MQKLQNQLATLIATLTIVTAPPLAHAGADFKWWATGQTSGQINLTTASGTQRTNLPSNPTGAQTVRSANTQAPTVIVQATASLPIKVAGDACTVSTSGTSPNQTAGEGTAITLDRTTLLSCQSGTWQKQSSGGSGSYKFKVPGDGRGVFYRGSGTIAAGKFSGQLICDPDTSAFGGNCGRGGFAYYCSTAICVGTNAGGYSGTPLIIDILNLPVDTVTQRW